MFGIDDAISAGTNMISTITNKIWPDANEKEKDKLTLALQEMNNQYALVLGQIDTNKVEAANPHWFVAGWRPFIGWIGGGGIGYEVLLKPIGNAICVAYGIPPVFPSTDVSLLQTLVMGMLGLVGARSWDKSSGTETKRLS